MKADATPSITGRGVTRGHVPASGALKRAAAALLTAGLWMSAAPAVAAPGDLDTSFSGDGVATINLGSSLETAEGVALQSDGKVVIVANDNGGAFYVIRYTADGALDGSFGQSGFFLGFDDFYLTSVAVQGDGKIVYAGYTTGSGLDFAVGRVTASGAADTSFGSAGRVVTPISTVSSNGQPDDRAYGVAVQSDGKIVVVGSTAMPYASGTYRDVAVVRYNTNGSLDTSFGSSGISRVHIGGDGNSRSSTGYAVAIQTDGKIVVGATANNGSDTDFAVVRLNTNGGVDTSFGGGNGRNVTNVATCGGSNKCDPADEVRGLAIQGDGKIVLAGWAQNGIVDSDNPNNDTRDTNFALVRYNANGSLDTGFGTSGTVTTRVSNTAPIPGTNVGPEDRAYAVAVQSDGKIVVAGQSVNVSFGDTNRALLRYNSNGSLDTGFGPGTGKVLNGGSGFEGLRALALQTDGKIVVTGEGSNIDVLRFEGTSVAPPSGGNPRDFNGDGKSDIVWQNTSNGQRAIWFMNGSTFAGSADLGFIPVAWQIAATGDFNGDNKADIVWQNTSTGQRVIWFMNGATYAGSADLGFVPVAWQIATTGDFNADGKTDIVWQNSSNGERAIWFMNGSTLVSGGSLGLIPTAWQIVGSGDFNSDGKPDLVWQNTSNGERVIWFMNGSTNIGGVSLFTIATNWQIAGAGDFNGDGKPDILWQNASNGDRVIWFMNGASYASGISLGVVSTNWQIAR